MRLMRAVVIVCLAMGLAAMRGTPVHAQTTLYVNSCTDTALRNAVSTANSDNANDTILFTCGGDYDLTAPLAITGTMTIDGSNGTIRINGQNSTQLFTVAPNVTLTLKVLTLENGKATGTDGGAVHNSGTVDVSRTIIEGSYADGSGGAIYNTGTVNATLTYIRNTSAVNGGGAIFNGGGGVVTVDQTTFLSDSAKYGGAIDNYSGRLNVTNSTFDTDESINGGYGGAILNYGSAVIENSTFYDNSAGVGGGAIYSTNELSSGGSVTVQHGTFSNNSATYGGGITVVAGGTAFLGADIIANSTGGNCYNAGSTFIDEGYNLEDTSDTCGFSSLKHDLIDVNPDFGPYGFNGVPSGPTQTIALQRGSPAIDYIHIPTGVNIPNLCPGSGTDQRGYPRPDSNEVSCDIGAYEYQDGYVLPGNATAYDIESSNFACPGGGSACVPTGFHASDCLMTTACPGLTYGDAEAFGRPNNSTYGVPDELVLFCAHGTPTGYDAGFLDVVSSQGSTDYSGGVYGNADLGAVSGKGTLIGRNGSEDNPSQASSINASGYDRFTGVIGSVAGTQNTDNGANRLNNGSFTVTIRGMLLRVDTTGSSPVVNTYTGTISCTVGGSHAYDLFNADKDTTSLAEGELENTLGDNFFGAGLISQLQA